MYVARHSLASIAHGRHIPLSIISEGLGHDSERTTSIYLASLDNQQIDAANRAILKLL
jgi:integrase